MSSSQPEVEGETAPAAKRRFRPRTSTEAPSSPSDVNPVLLQLAAEAFSERPTTAATRYEFQRG